MGKYLRFFVALCMQIRCNLEVKRGVWKVGRDDFEQIFGGFRGQDGFFLACFKLMVTQNCQKECECLLTTSLRLIESNFCKTVTHILEGDTFVEKMIFVNRFKSLFMVVGLATS